MKIDNLDDVVSHLRTLLPKYLELHGVDTSKRFKCINPEHDEDTPSSILNPKTGYTQGHCFGCNQSFDIFTAAHWIEGLPADGASWVTETVPELAKELKIKIDYVEPSEEEKERLGVYKAYADTAKYVANEKTGAWAKDVENYISDHRWDKKFLSTIGVGVCDEDEYIAWMLTIGYSVDYLVDVQLLPPRGASSHHTPQIFAHNQLVFTINDEMGRPCGFGARRFEGVRKFVNTGSTGEYDIYQKSNRLYNLDVAKKTARTGKALWVIEGYGDVISARSKSVDNVAAMCGTALTLDQLKTISRCGIHDIVLCYDFDDAGQKSCQRVIENILPEVTDLRVRIATPLDDNDWDKDPGDLIEEQGVQGLLGLPLVSPFDWLLERCLKEDGSDPASIVLKLVPVIASEPNAVIRDTQTNSLVEKTGIAKYAIELEVRKRTEEAVAQQERTRQMLTKQFTQEINTTPENAVQLCEDYMTKFESLEGEYEADRYSVTSSLHMCEKQRDIQESKTASDVSGFVLPFMPHFQEALGAGQDWKYKHLLMLGGEENTGKSSWMSWFLYNIACHDANDAICIYWTIDDSEDQLLPKFVAIANTELQGYVPVNPGEPTLTINNVINPQRSVLGLSDAEAQAVLKRRANAYNRVEELMRNERLIIKDSKSGTSLSYAKGIVRYYRQKYPSRPIVLVVDNTHNLSDHSGLREIRDRFTRIANTMKNGLCVKYDATLLASVEYRKKSDSIEPDKIRLPNNDRIAEARAFKYRANWIGHIYNDLKERPTKHSIFHRDPITGDKLPRNGLFHSKSKINGYYGTQYGNFYTNCSSFKEIDNNDVKLEAEKFIQVRKEEGKEEKNES